MNRLATLAELFSETRRYSEFLCEPLQIEDYVVQPVVDVSPPKWHLGHTTWFFEEFILKPLVPGYRLFHPDFAFVFNSYYEAVGARVVRSDRGNLSRPGVSEVYDYRQYVTAALLDGLNSVRDADTERLAELLEIGIHHEKQHQELLLTDIKYILGTNPLLPAYREDFDEGGFEDETSGWIGLSEGLYDIGHRGDSFCFDNEKTAHQVYLQPFEIATRLVTNAEYLAFIQAGGYGNHDYWHSEGWGWVTANQVQAPLYWYLVDGEWYRYDLTGLRHLDPDQAVTHLSYYEAFAYARWKGVRLPTEFEWEAAQERFRWGSRWEWTESAYLPYPGFTREAGALGEYNGKFMVNQKVLRGASVATPAKHSRPTYRNFFHPPLRWQFTGLRLAKNP